jgi:NitT/TauT family transport system substrate-binding protein
LKLEPIYIRGGLMGIQAALSGDLPLQLQGASTVVAAWAQGAKDFQFIGAVGNRLDYILAAHPSIKRPEDLKGKKIGVSQLGSSTDFIARVAVRRLGLNAEKDVQIVGIGGQGDRWTGAYVGTDSSYGTAISIYTESAQGRLPHVYRFFQRGF